MLPAATGALLGKRDSSYLTELTARTFIGIRSRRRMEHD